MTDFVGQDNMILLRTRHSLHFNPLSSKIEPDKSPYASMYTDYKSKRMEIGKLIGTNDFIWCIPLARSFKHYEKIKPVEWEIQVSNNRILGYVNDEEWVNYLEERSTSVSKIYYHSPPPASNYSVLVSYPLIQNEIVKTTIFRIITSDKVEIICERIF
jgi:hypothetical protein